MGENPKLLFDYYASFVTNSLAKLSFGRKALMRGVSTEYTGEPAKKWVKNYSGFA